MRIFEGMQYVHFSIFPREFWQPLIGRCLVLMPRAQAPRKAVATNENHTLQCYAECDRRNCDYRIREG